MIPFLKHKLEASSSAPVESKMREPDGEEYDPLHAAAEDLISAIHSKSVKAVAEALKAAFELCEMEPHAETPHIESEE